MKNRSNLIRACAFFSLSLLSCGMPGAPAGARRHTSDAAAATYALRPAYKVGDAARYKFTVHFTTDREKQSDLDVTDTRFNMTMLETVKQAAPDGGVTLEDVIDKADGVFDEREIELTAIMPRVTQTRDKNGAAAVNLTGGLEQVRPGVTQVFELLARTQRNFYPPAPVAVGGTWKINTQETGASEGRTQGTGTLAGIETLNGQPILKINVDFTSTLKVQDLRRGGKIDVTYHFLGTENVDAKTFKLLRLEGRSDDSLPEGEKAKTEILLTQVTDKAKAEKTTEDTKHTEKNTQKNTEKNADKSKPAANNPRS